MALVVWMAAFAVGAGTAACSEDGSPTDAEGGGGPGSAGASSTGGGDSGNGGSNDGGSERVNLPAYEKEGTRIVPAGELVGSHFQRRTLYDRELEGTCSYLRTDELSDTYHCVVTAAFGEMLFADDACTAELARPSTNQCSAQLQEGDVVSLYVYDGENRQVLRTLSDSVTAPETLYWRQPGSGDCVAIENTAPTLFEVEVTDLTQFVEAQTELVESAHPDLQIRVHAGSDGSRFAFNTFPLTLRDGQPCEPTPVDGLGTLHCVPEIPDAVTTSEPFDGCQRITSIEYNGSPRPSDSFPELVLSTSGSGRVVPEVYTTVEGMEVLPTGQWVDTAEDETCSLETFEDGSLRCVSADFTEPSHYSDDACTERVYSRFVGGCNPPAEASVIRVEREGAEINCRQTVSETVRQKIYTGNLWRLEGEACISATVEEGVGYFVNDGTFGAGDFAAIERIEPR